MNSKAIIQAALFGLGGCFLITWMNEGGHLKQYSDLVTFEFITKVVGNFVVLTGLNTYFAHRSFRDPEARTRAEDSSLSTPNIREVLNRRK